MNQSEQIELARAYVALSNAHRVELISTLFADSIRYDSFNVGSFEGKDAVAEMMTKFYSRYPDVRWDIVDYQTIEKGLVGFEFIMTGTEASNGRNIEVVGLEQITFTEDGLISGITVKAQ